MRRLLILIVALLAVAVAGNAGAALLNYEASSATKVGDLAPVILSGGGVATVNGSGGIGGHLGTLAEAASRGGVAGTNTTLVTDPETEGNGIAAVIVSAEGGTGTFGNISGAVSSGGGLTPNTLPVHGVAKVCLINTTCNQFLNLLLTRETTVNGVPGGNVVGVGVGGLVTVGGGTNTIRISLQGAPWTVKTAGGIDQIETAGGNTTFVTLTAKGFAHGPASATSSSTAGVDGVIQLVTPVQVVTNLQFGTSKKLGGWLVVTTKFVPEPGLLVLLGSGVVGLAVVGRKRMRR